MKLIIEHFETDVLRFRLIFEPGDDDRANQVAFAMYDHLVFTSFAQANAKLKEACEYFDIKDNYLDLYQPLYTYNGKDDGAIQMPASKSKPVA